MVQNPCKIALFFFVLLSLLHARTAGSLFDLRQAGKPKRRETNSFFTALACLLACLLRSFVRFLSSKASQGCQIGNFCSQKTQIWELLKPPGNKNFCLGTWEQSGNFSNASKKFKIELNKAFKPHLRSMKISKFSQHFLQSYF